jgi:hypothetical protein
MGVRKKRTKTFGFILVSKNHRITNLVSHNRMRYFLYICLTLKCIYIQLKCIHKELDFHKYLHGMVFHNHKLIQHCRDIHIRIGLDVGQFVFHLILEHHTERCDNLEPLLKW